MRLRDAAWPGSSFLVWLLSSFQSQSPQNSGSSALSGGPLCTGDCGQIARWGVVPVLKKFLVRATESTQLCKTHRYCFCSRVPEGMYNIFKGNPIAVLLSLHTHFPSHFSGELCKSLLVLGESNCGRHLLASAHVFATHQKSRGI